MNSIMICMRNKEIEIKNITTFTLWNLIYNNQRVKGKFKKNNLIENLNDIQFQIEQGKFVRIFAYLKYFS